jgi:hypothetical protein
MRDPEPRLGPTGAEVVDLITYRERSADPDLLRRKPEDILNLIGERLPRPDPA